jgi:hypothetical protein
MKIIKTIVFLILSKIILSQGTVYYDRIEDWNWASGWAVGYGNNTGFYSNAYVSPNLSTAIIGNGNASSNIEEGYYISPNITGLDPNNSYTFSFRLASYRFSSTGSTSGVDATDYVTLIISTDGGVTWNSEIRVTGRSNAFWDYNNNAFVLKSANGILSTYSPSGGGNRTSTNDGISTIVLELPPGITQYSFRIQTRVNSTGEEWWLDDIELSESVPLPVDLIEFYGEKKSNGNLIKWKTASEFNSSHFILQKSTTGLFLEESYLHFAQSAGNSTEEIDYSYFDENPDKTINYYKLLQYDIDGEFKDYGPISVDNSCVKQVIKKTDLFGRIVDVSFTGIIILHYSDGTFVKSYQ